MANAIILHRRRRAEVVVPGSQTFTNNGVFVVPYSAVYWLSVTGSRAKSGDGGKGGNSHRDQQSWNQNSFVCGGGGGGGGGAAQPAAYTTVQFELNKGQEVQVTVNGSVVSFGNYTSCATGVAGENGGAGDNWDESSGSQSGYHYGGYGGEGGRPPVITGALEYASIPDLEVGVSGAAGKNGTGYQLSGSPDAGDGNGPVKGGAGGQTTSDIRGGNGSDSPRIEYPNRNAYAEDGKAGSPAVTGSITISWGGNT